MVWGLCVVCVCVWTEGGKSWKAPSAGAIQGHPRRSVSFAPGQRGVQTEGGGGWDLLTPLAFFCEAELVIWTENWICAQRSLGSKAVKQPAVRAHSGGEGLNSGWPICFHSFIHSSFPQNASHPSAPSRSLTVLIRVSVIGLVCLDSPRTVHRLHCWQCIPVETQFILASTFVLSHRNKKILNKIVFKKVQKHAV